jgi:hypothetical protein
MVRSDPSASHTKPVALHVAASVVHQQLSPGTISDDYREALDRTALALSHLADIFYVDGEGRLKRIPDAVLAAGAFVNGARMFRSAAGELYQSLSMRRGDVAEAISILRNARAGAARRRQQSRTEET